jgi:poly-gamma-glutamate synthesis protein (capsule biosynthesis protein)
MVLAREIIAAGTDLVVGSGPHVVQPAELCLVNDPQAEPGVGSCAIRTDDGVPRTAAVLYSLGNFASVMATTPCQVGVVATVSLGPGVTGLQWQGVATVDDGAGPSVVPLADRLFDPELAAESARLDAHLGTRWKR